MLKMELNEREQAGRRGEEEHGKDNESPPADSDNSPTKWVGILPSAVLAKRAGPRVSCQPGANTGHRDLLHVTCHYPEFSGVF